MKKLVSIFTLFIFALYANDAPLLESSDAKSPPIYAKPNPPLQERQEQSSSKWKTTAAVVGTLVAITVGLFASGRDTGKDYHKNSD